MTRRLEPVPPVRTLLARVTPRRKPLQVTDPPTTIRDQRMDRATRLAAAILATIVLTVFAVGSVLLLAGCGRPMCSGHGGVLIRSASWTYCNDGTVEPG
jgi:hypothetical protein